MKDGVVMKLWTIQPETVYEYLLVHKVIHCDATKSELIQECGFEKPYQWMVKQMRKRIGNPTTEVKFPIWAWHTLDGKQHKPDLRNTEFRAYKGNQVCLELDVPANEVLLSDEIMWHTVLSDCYLESSTEEHEMDEELRQFELLPKEQQKIVKEKSWEKIFDVYSLQNDTAFNEKCSYIQATFWELKLEYVVDVRHFKGRLY